MTSYKRLLPRKVGSPRAEGNTDLSTTLADSEGPDSSPLVCFVSTVACGRCRQKKAKCGGQRPICDRCALNGTDCHYDANVGESRSSALKKRYGALDREVRQLREENRHFKKLYGSIRTGTENEALKVLSNIRSSSNYDPIVIPRLLSQDDDTLAGPSVSSGSAKGNEDTSVKTFNAFVANVQALPWTVVAGDDVVSELISQYFTFDYLYVFPPIPRSIFIYEMNKADPAAATACTPLLVNAICAQQCFLSPKESFGATPRRDMAEQFLLEANTLLQKETKQNSLPTCQATCLIHAAAAVKGETRGGVFANDLFG